MIKTVLIVTSKSDMNLVYFNNDETYVIGVERGCLDLIEKNIKIDLAISDFDKITIEELASIKDYAKEIIIESTDKDYLDGELAAMKAAKFPNARLLFIAKPTKRYDMNLSIFGIVFKYGVTMINDESVIFLIKKGETTLSFDNYQDKTFVSFFAKKPTILTIQNMKYNIENMKLDVFENACISNTFIPYVNPTITNDEDIICIMTK